MPKPQRGHHVTACATIMRRHALYFGMQCCTARVRA
jgi:hypothetical protein